MQFSSTKKGEREDQYSNDKTVLPQIVKIERAVQEDYLEKSQASDFSHFSNIKP